MTTGNFEYALKQMRLGKKMAREGWGAGMSVFIVSNLMASHVAPHLGIHGTKYHAHIDMCTAAGEIEPWMVSQADILADDWQEAE